MFVGVDVSKKKLDVFIRPIGESFVVGNDAEGHAELARRCSLAKASIVLFESTGGYERAATHVLLEQNIDVAVVNPARTRDFAKALGKLAKTDAIDAEVIAEYAEIAKVRLLVKTDEETQQATEQLVRRRQLVDMRAQEKTRLQQVGRKVRPSVLKLIQHLDEQIGETEKDIDRFLRERLDKKLALLDSIPGFGDVVKRTLLLQVPELGQLTRQQVAALVGLAPFNVDSGEHRGQRHIKGGRSEPRAVLYMAAVSVLRGKTVFGQFYRTLIGKGKPPKVAITAVCRKMLVTANAVLRDGKPWAPQPT